MKLYQTYNYLFQMNKKIFVIYLNLSWASNFFEAFFPTSFE